MNSVKNFISGVATLVMLLAVGTIVWGFWLFVIVTASRLIW